MTLIGVLSDAHGNPFGLNACLAALSRAGAEALYFLGDAVGYLPGERAVLAGLAASGAVCQQGNHEAMLLGRLPLDARRDEVYGLTEARERLAATDRALLATWPESRELVLDRRRILLVHGSPTDPLRGYVYPDSDLSGYAALGYDAIFLGNTHRPFVAESGGVLVANVGSCGLPRDQGDLAACLLYDTRLNVATVLRVVMPTKAVLAQFGGVHPAVYECLHRSVPNPFGSIVGHT